MHPGVVCLSLSILFVSAASATLIWRIPSPINPTSKGPDVELVDGGFLVTGRAEAPFTNSSSFLSKYAIVDRDSPPKQLWSYVPSFLEDLWTPDTQIRVKNNRAVVWVNRTPKVDAIAVVDLTTGTELWSNATINSIEVLGCWVVDLSPDAKFLFLGFSHSSSGVFIVSVIDATTGWFIKNLTIVDEQRCGINWFSQTLFGLGANPTLNVFDTQTFSLQLSQNVGIESLPYTLSCPQPSVAVHNEWNAQESITFYNLQSDPTNLNLISKVKVPQYKLMPTTLSVSDDCTTGAAISFDYFSPTKRGLVYDYFLYSFDLQQGTFFPGSGLKINGPHVPDTFLAGTALAGHHLIVGYNHTLSIYKLTDLTAPPRSYDTIGHIMSYKLLPMRWAPDALVVESTDGKNYWLALYRIY